ncbi:MAG: hypothetical protein MUF42_10000 [Cytophagaceae bacterium]|jgi:hypothetical protein|nr:hypothetical protein [Cytophagaceae bacterium]
MKNEMLRVTYKNKDYEFPLLKGNSTNWISLKDENIDIELIFTVPSSMIQNVYSETNIIQTDDNPIIVLNLEINHTEYNFDTEELIPIGNLSLKPNVNDLENIELSDKIVQESTLYFPGYASRSTIKSISFGEVHNNEINIEFSGTCIDIKGELYFEVTDVKVPVQNMDV